MYPLTRGGLPLLRSFLERACPEWERDGYCGFAAAPEQVQLGEADLAADRIRSLLIAKSDAIVHRHAGLELVTVNASLAPEVRAEINFPTSTRSVRSRPWADCASDTCLIVISTALDFSGDYVFGGPTENYHSSLFIKHLLAVDVEASISFLSNSELSSSIFFASGSTRVQICFSRRGESEISLEVLALCLLDRETRGCGIVCLDQLSGQNELGARLDEWGGNRKPGHTQLSDH